MRCNMFCQLKLIYISLLAIQKQSLGGEKFTGKQMCRGLFFNEFYQKKELLRRSFSVSSVKLLRTHSSIL